MLFRKSPVAPVDNSGVQAGISANSVTHNGSRRELLGPAPEKLGLFAGAPDYWGRKDSIGSGAPLDSMQSLGVPQQLFPDYFLLFVSQARRREAEINILTLRALGVPWERIPVSIHWEMSKKLRVAEFKAFCEEPSSRYHLELSAQTTTAATELKTFPCLMQSEPYAVHQSFDPISGSAQPKIFALRLTEEEAKYFSARQQDPHSKHVLGSFAYLRYYDHDGQVVVAEIQSDYFTGLASPELRQRYAHWQRILLKGFEDFIAQTRNTPTKVSIADADYQMRRWPCRNQQGEIISAEVAATDPEVRLGMPRDLARIIYEQIPYRLGYRELVTVAGAVETRKLSNLEKSENEAVPLQRCRSKMVAPEDAAKVVPISGAKRIWKNIFPDALAAYLTEEELSPVIPSSMAPIENFPRCRARKLSGPYRGIIRTNALLYLAESASGSRPEMVEHYLANLSIAEYLLDGPRRLRRLGTYCYFSPGTGPGIRRNWAELFNAESEKKFASSIVHTHGRPRYLSICFSRLVERNTMSFSVDVKGGGICRLDESVKVHDPEPSLRLPVYLKLGATRESNSNVSGAGLLGGLTLSEASVEFTNLLAVTQFSRELFPRLRILMPYPLAISGCTALPVWDKASGQLAEMVPEKEYRRRFLNGSQEPLVQLKTLAGSHIRMSQVLDRIFFRGANTTQHNPAVVEFAIDQAVSLLYGLNQQNFSDPKLGLRRISEGQITPQEILEFLYRIATANKTKPKRIAREIELRTLMLLGAVHGAGGHLGGSCQAAGPTQSEKMLDHTGIKRGSSALLASIDIRGWLSDFGPEVYLPWKGSSAYSYQRREAEQVELAKNQMADLRYWEHSIYWIRNLLFGRKLEQGEQLGNFPFGDPAYRNNFGPEAGCKDETARALLRYRDLGRDIEFTEQDHAACYHEAYRRGRWFAQQYGYQPGLPARTPSRH